MYKVNHGSLQKVTLSLDAGFGCVFVCGVCLTVQYIQLNMDMFDLCLTRILFVLDCSAIRMQNMTSCVGEVWCDLLEMCARDAMCMTLQGSFMHP